MSKKTESETLSNSFGLSEWSGAFGDLGILLPLTFVLTVYTGLPVTRLFFLWGLVYLFTGHYYKVPVSVQPLKAMAVIAITSGLGPDLLSATAFFYGLLFIVLTFTKALEFLQRLFSAALIRGIQLSVGLMLARKAFDLVSEHAFYLGMAPVNSRLVSGLIIGIVVILFIGLLKSKNSMVLFILIAGLLISLFSGVQTDLVTPSLDFPVFVIPGRQYLFDALILLIVPQLPLTLGNAVFSAQNVCNEFWPERSKKVTISKLAGSIGLSNIVIGLLGGFPICHGAGGIAAHARFGAKTGGATMIMGLILIALALIKSWIVLLFLIPVPILSALLLIESWALAQLLGKLKYVSELLVAITVGVSAFLTYNLSFGLLMGFAVQGVLRTKLLQAKFKTFNQNLNTSSRFSESST